MTTDTALTRPELSTESERLRSWLGLPLSILPPPREITRQGLGGYTRDLNHLISARAHGDRVEAMAHTHVPSSWRKRHSQLFQLDFQPIWTPEELEEIRGEDVWSIYERWRHQLDHHPHWSKAAGSIQPSSRLVKAWQSIPEGDFSAAGRGRDYTIGMEYFQAARALGVETLLGLLGGPGGIYLDVLGGDGYVLRISGASRKLRRKRLFIGELADSGWDRDLDRLTQATERVPRSADSILALAISAPKQGIDPREDGRSWNARTLAIGRSLAISERFSLTAEELSSLETDAAVLVLEPHPDIGGMMEAIDRRLETLARDDEMVILTNDISPHMFFSAGLWGFPTREDARSLSRTFKEASIDGILFAYGTHHIVDFDSSFRESFKVCRPGGRIVVHDFLDEGRVGTWFHEVVHRRSRTGHDFPHVSPIQLAVSLLLAGFRNVELSEMEDPFVFTSLEKRSSSARHVAFTYLLGMYGMNESFGDDRNDFELTVNNILSYPEICNTPVFSDDFVYIPRRALVARAQRPLSGEENSFGSPDRSLIKKITELLSISPRELVERFQVPSALARAWFPENGTRWGVTSQLQYQWKRWLGDRRLPLASM